MKKYSSFLLLLQIYLFSITFFSYTNLIAQSKEKQNKLLVNVEYHNEAELTDLESKYDIWHVDVKNKKVFMLLSQKEFEFLDNLNLKIEVDGEKTLRLKNQIFTLSGYRTVEEIYVEMAELPSKYPDLVELTDYGDSWEKTTAGGKAGYDLFALKITNKNIKAKKPPIVIPVGDSTFETAKAQGGISMHLSDGAAASHIEQFEMEIKTSGYEPGKYYLFVRGKDGSGAWGSFTAQYLKIKTPTHVDNELLKMPESPVLIKSYPNPFSDFTTIQIEVNSKMIESDRYELSIFNITGQLVKKKTFFSTGGSSFQFSWPDQNENVLPGLYFVILNTQSLTEKHKVLLVR